LAVACALAGEPDLLFLDEPTTGLDPQSRRALWDVVEAFQAAGRTILLTTHYMEEAARLCDRVAIMDHGRVIALGPPAELVASLGADHVVRIELADGEAAGAAGALDALPGVSAVLAEGGAFLLTVREVHTALPALLDTLASRGLALAGLSTHHATLEDVFVSLTGRSLREE
jgi:ABC-2 type transport system ATP-binding protein